MKWMIGLLLAIGMGTTCAQSCAYVGDSIALGAGISRQGKITGCSVLAKQGINARQWRNFYSTVQADRVLVSMGSNDKGANVHLEIAAMRRAITAREVVWIAPGPQFAASRASVLWVAETFGDVVYERPYDDIAPDNVHFTRRGYDRIANVLHE